MSCELDGILESKRAFRQRLATQPIEDEPALLDALRKRALAPRESRPGAAAGRISAFGDAARSQEKS